MSKNDKAETQLLWRNHENPHTNLFRYEQTMFFLHKPINWVFKRICLPSVLCLIYPWWTQKVTLMYRQNKLFPHRENIKLLVS